MTTPRLTSGILDDLKGHAAARNREGYYQVLEDAGFAYGALAGGVATHETFSGRFANAYLSETAHWSGVSINEARAIEIGEALMRADFAAR